MSGADASHPILVKAFPPVWALTFLGAALALHYFLPQTRVFDLSSPVVGALLIALGLSLNVWAWSLFWKAGTEFEPTSPSNRALVISGPFRFTRNPMYMGVLALLLGIAFCVGSLPMFLVPTLMFVVLIIVFVPYEEAKMARQFGSEYESYKHRVRRWL